MNNWKLILAAFIFLMHPLHSFGGTWQTISIKDVQVLPNGGVNIRSENIYSGCGQNGANSLPFSIRINSYGVTNDGIKGMLSMAMAALVSGKQINISYYPADNCIVDSITLIK